MTITLTYAWWWIPTIITASVFIWWFTPKNHGGNYPDIAALFNLFTGMFIIAISWALGGIFK